MKKISDIISMPLISLYESEFLGVIQNVLFDSALKKCTCAIVLNENENITQAINMSNIHIIGKDCVYIRNKTCLELETNCLHELNKNKTPMNLPTYNLQGEYAGICTDIYIDENYEVIKILLNTGEELNSEKIFNISKNTLIINNQKISKNKFKPKTKFIKFEDMGSKVIILSDSIKEKNEQVSIPPAPSHKIITDYRFLVGRILNKDIMAINGEMIAKKDTIVTKDIINKASLYGKLVEISRYSTKNKNA